MDNELRERAIAGLESLQNSRDIEMAHVEADAILMELLESLGYGDVVDAYGLVPKWYA